MTKIAFFGTGLLGEPMAHQLLKAGYDLTVYNRTISKTESLAQSGAMVAHHPESAKAESDVVITMLTDYPAIREVLFSHSQVSFKEKTLIQMSTISPKESIQLKEEVETEGGQYIEAPVLGSIPQARSQTLFILLGGTAEQLEQHRGLLSVFGNKIIHFGEVGKAAAAKLALNQLIGSLTTAFSMSLGYLRNKDVDLEKFMGILRDSALYSPSFDKKLDRMMNRDFSNPNFPVKHLLKDVNLMIRDFGDANIETAALEGVQSILMKAMENGDSELDYSALYNSVHPADNV